MATYVSNLYAKNGKRLSIYHKSTHPVGEYCPTELNGVATANSSFEFTIPQGEVFEVTDFTTTNTAGEIELVVDGVPRQRFLPTDASRAASATNRPPINMTLVNGPRYKFRHTVAGAA